MASSFWSRRSRTRVHVVDESFEEPAEPSEEELGMSILQEERIRVERQIQKLSKDVPGLTIEHLFAGDGITYPLQSDTVKVQYKVQLAGGNEVVESSKDRGCPLMFKIGAGEVIPGFELGVRRMTEGETARLSFGPELGYGSKSTIMHIPPNSNLVIEVDLLKVVPAEDRRWMQDAATVALRDLKQ